MKRAWMASVVAAVAVVAVPGNAAASTYTNPNPVEIPEDGLATPYPSTITVTDLPGAVTGARATLNGLTLAYPQDLEIVLVAPAGNYTLLMADVCGASDDEFVNQTFTFDDAAATTLPLGGPCASGTYRPTDAPDQSAEPPPPAPPGDLTVAAMSALNGSPASGTWQLFIHDEVCCDGVPPDPHLAGGWTLDLLTDATCSGRPATLTGTAGDEELVGTEGDDVILGFGGKDTILGLGGSDVVCGGDAKDTLRGGSGKDKVVGQGGKDKVLGNGGKDKLLGKGGPDKLNGGPGNDICKGGKKDDTAKNCEVEKSI